MSKKHKCPRCLQNFSSFQRLQSHLRRKLLCDIINPDFLPSSISEIYPTTLPQFSIMRPGRIRVTASHRVYFLNQGITIAK